MQRWMTSRVAKLAVSVKARFPEGPPALSSDDAELCARLLARYRDSSVSGDTLVAAIRAAPLDDSARNVYSDWLLDRSDPRGELLVLQMQRRQALHGTLDDAGERRELELLTQYARAWMGEIEPLVEKYGWAFEGGFLARCCVDLGNAKLVQQLTGSEAWATVQEIHFSRHKLPVPIVTHPAMRSLRRIGSLWWEGVSEAVRLGLPLEYVGCDESLGGAELVVESRDRIASLDMPSLRGLGLSSSLYFPALYRFLWSTKVGRQLTHLRIPHAVRYLHHWVRELDEVKPPLASFTFGDDDKLRGWTCLLTRGTDGRLSRLTISVGPKPEFALSNVDELVKSLGELRPGELTAFRLLRTAYLPPKRKQLQSALTRLELGELIVPP
jgi:uncharacterized protein (TIGR02996 family)